MIKLSQLQAPALAGVVKGKNARGAIAEIKNCICDGATMIDLHVSCLEDTSVDGMREIFASSKLPVLALNYNSTYENKPADFSEEERIASLLRAVEAGAAGIDMQGYTFHLPSKNEFCGEDKYSFTKGNPREIVTDSAIIDRQCALIEQVHSMGAEVLLSCHPSIFMSCDAVVDLALYLEKRNPDIIKIVTRADDEDDLPEIMKTMLMLKKEVKKPVSYHASGKGGMLSRIFNPIIGGQIAFCVDRYNEASTMEQLDLKSTKAIVDYIQRMF